MSARATGLMEKAALAYALRLEFPVFPLHTPTPNGRTRCSCNRDDCTSIGKHPRTMHGLKDATKDAATIHGWFGETWPDANIGILTGEASNVFVLDIDPRHGGDEALGDLEKKNGPLPATVTALTGGGGEHRLFRHVPGVGNSAKRLGSGLDVRGEGGYIVAAPSLHESGRVYAWSVDHHVRDMEIASAPMWLLDLLQEPKGADGQRLPVPASEWTALLSQPLPEGSRTTTLTRLAGHFLRRNIDPFVALETLRCWNFVRCKPPLDDDVLIATVDSIARREMQRRNGATNGR